MQACLRCQHMTQQCLHTRLTVHTHQPATCAHRQTHPEPLQARLQHAECNTLDLSIVFVEFCSWLAEFEGKAPLTFAGRPWTR